MPMTPDSIPEHADAGPAAVAAPPAPSGATAPAPQPRLARWERRTRRPLLGLALLFAAAYAVPVLDPGLPDALHRACRTATWAVWAVFAADYAVRLRLADDRWRFVRTHLLDLCAVLLPLIRPLRLLQLVSALLLTGRLATAAAQVRLTTYVAGSVLVLWLFGALAVLEVERGKPDANIHTVGDAVWWAFTTMTTVGYGDLAPTTGLGRLLAIGLMISGIALLGLVTANIAAWFISQVKRESEHEEQQTAALRELTREVASLRAEVTALRQAGAAPAGGAVPGPAGEAVPRPAAPRE
ncbi:potassium channel family protein [Streptomyces sp. NBC_01808]|uniref:potassium channel family protein n=1 Tax=Streptomyces sp. NBC_01808 TaxID=2975947 RepID=UPI002DD7B752|nr:potassium channel family protein [Streptomyces sp. NBC_01808]WSA37577.1 potassium channel family protein [Streptomyces sp. NBC_01808]